MQEILPELFRREIWYQNGGSFIFFSARIREFFNEFKNRRRQIAIRRINDLQFDTGENLREFALKTLLSFFIVAVRDHRHVQSHHFPTESFREIQRAFGKSIYFADQNDGLISRKFFFSAVIFANF